MSDQDTSITEAEPEAVATDPAGDQSDPDGAEHLGDPGKRALAAMKAQLKAAKAEAAALKARVDEFEDRDKSEIDRATARLQEAERTAQSYRDRAVRAEVRALAATAFADPEDAAAFLDLSRYVEGGEIDTEAIQADLSELLSRKPHLAKPTGPRVPQPDPSQGARSDGPAGLDEQIREAEQKGDVRLALHLQNQKLLKAAGKK